MQIIGITGMPLAGKTTVAEILEQEGFSKISMGNIVRKEMKNQGISQKNTSEFVSKQREENGEEAIAKLTKPVLKAEKKKEDKIVISGLRSIEEKRFLSKGEQDIKILAIWASNLKRKKRRDERRRKEDVEGQEFEKRDRRELEQGVGNLIAKSDYLIKNESLSITQLEKEVKKIVK